MFEVAQGSRWPRYGFTGSGLRLKQRRRGKGGEGRRRKAVRYQGEILGRDTGDAHDTAKIKDTFSPIAMPYCMLPLSTLSTFSSTDRLLG
jgi:hypothetical protein